MKYPWYQHLCSLFFQICLHDYIPTILHLMVKCHSSRRSYHQYAQHRYSIHLFGTFFILYFYDNRKDLQFYTLLEEVRLGRIHGIWLQKKLINTPLDSMLTSTFVVGYVNNMQCSTNRRWEIPYIKVDRLREWNSGIGWKVPACLYQITTRGKSYVSQ